MKKNWTKPRTASSQARARTGAATSHIRPAHQRAISPAAGKAAIAGARKKRPSRVAGAGGGRWGGRGEGGRRGGGEGREGGEHHPGGGGGGAGGPRGGGGPAGGERQ